MVKVHYIHHSAFAVEFEEKILIFDYFDPARMPEYPFTGHLPELAGKKVYFFASHKHRDHFDMDILHVMEREPAVRYILSKDTRMSGNFLKKHGFSPERIKTAVKYVTPLSDYEIDDLKIHTLRSTDEGVAFVVETEGKTIYHAGDLHWWQMEGVGELINGKTEREYKHQLRYLEGKLVNYAFVVLDPRLGPDQFRGMDYFMKTVMADHVFPMHMWQQLGLIRLYKSRSDNKSFTDRIVDITEENQVFMF